MQRREKVYLKNPETGRLKSREVAYEHVYLPNKEKYPFPFSQYEVHHINKDTLDNRPSNLAIVTHEEHEGIHGRTFGRETTFGGDPTYGRGAPDSSRYNDRTTFSSRTTLNLEGEITFVVIVLVIVIVLAVFLKIPWVVIGLLIVLLYNVKRKLLN